MGPLFGKISKNVNQDRLKVDRWNTLTGKGCFIRSSSGKVKVHKSDTETEERNIALYGKTEDPEGFNVGHLPELENNRFNFARNCGFITDKEYEQSQLQAKIYQLEDIEYNDSKSSFNAITEKIYRLLTKIEAKLPDCVHEYFNG